MVHTYEVMVDIREYIEQANNARLATARYEIDAESRQTADSNACVQAKCDYPGATEYDVRVTRLLR